MRTARKPSMYQIYDNETGRTYLEPFLIYESALYMAENHGPAVFIIVEVESGNN